MGATAEQAGRGREDALGDLFVSHGGDAVRLAYLMTGDRATAEDLAQEAFVRLLARWPAIKEPTAIRAYLMRTIANLSKNHYRRKNVERNFLDRASSPADSTSIPDIETRDELLSSLDDLPHRQRAAVVLRYCEDLSEQQTAEVMRTTPKAVKSLVARGLTALRAIEKGTTHG